jgi:hypothetical protein
VSEAAVFDAGEPSVAVDWTSETAS